MTKVIIPGYEQVAPGVYGRNYGLEYFQDKDKTPAVCLTRVNRIVPPTNEQILELIIKSAFDTFHPLKSKSNVAELIGSSIPKEVITSIATRDTRTLLDLVEEIQFAEFDLAAGNNYLYQESALVPKPDYDETKALNPSPKAFSKLMHETGRRNWTLALLLNTDGTINRRRIRRALRDRVRMSDTLQFDGFTMSYIDIKSKVEVILSAFGSPEKAKTLTDATQEFIEGRTLSIIEVFGQDYKAEDDNEQLS